MQWRAFILLLTGAVTIYLVSFLQDIPYPHPAKIYIEESPRTRFPSDETIISIVDGFLYQTSVWFEFPHQDLRGKKHGAGRMKAGVVGHVKQLRRPLEEVLVNTTSKSKGWEEVFQHKLNGPITSISILPSSNDFKNSDQQFAILYHVLKEEEAQHYARVYYLPVDTEESLPRPFEYKDCLMPGNTWVNSFSLERDNILFSRDPDNYRFRMIPLSSNFTAAPHSSEAGIIRLPESQQGDPFGRWYQPNPLEDHRAILTRLYSPDPDTYRVFTMDAHKTTQLHLNITIVDNQKSITQLTELRGEVPDAKWYWRAKADRTYESYEENTSEYIGFVEVAKVQHERVEIETPKLCLARSKDAKTIVFPFDISTFLTLDYTSRIDVLQKDSWERERLYRNEEGTFLPEYYYWSNDKIRMLDSYDAEIVGASLNANGNILALWTEYNNVYIYKRGDAKSPDAPKRTLSLVDKMDILLEEDHSGSTAKSLESMIEEALPPAWELSMVITPTEGGLTASRVGFVEFLNTTDGKTETKGNYILVGLKNGAVNSYSADDVEEESEINFWTFITDRWDIVVAMSIIVFLFVFNEYNHPS
ncbi:hypothetical protein BDF14DRAFT_1758712 [Spinellus fusiger]|nr:hypothetical protein BDF14DRAFT_1758712 [Spinellus fusiger]